MKVVQMHRITEDLQLSYSLKIRELLLETKKRLLNYRRPGIISLSANTRDLRQGLA